MTGTLLDRRFFLAACSGAGLGSPLLAGALWAASGGGERELSAEMLAAAARVAGLEFEPEDVERMLAGVRSNIAMYAELRALAIDQSVPPPLYFNPAIPGQVFETERRPFRLGPRGDAARPAQLEELACWPLTQLSRLIETRRLGSLELTRMYLERLKRHDAALNCVVTLTEELALEQASRADHEIARGEYRGPLHGIPWGVKDLLATRGYRTTWGFEAYRGQVIDMDATVVRRLEEAGAVLVAKLATGEIARGDIWFGGQTKNPWNPDQGAGGSSAGPAAATAAGLVGFSIGTDTTGSILGPSRNCGITGLRPTFGRVSRHGAMPVCWSLDRVGPMCRSAEDCAVVFDAIHGPDNQDLAVVDRPFNYDGSARLPALRVGYLDEAFDSSDPERANDRATLDALRELGCELAPVRLPAHAVMDELQMLLVDEAAAFDELLASGDIRYFNQDLDDPEDMLMRIARLVPAVEYLQINRRRMLLMTDLAKLFDDIDVLAAPHRGSPVLAATSLTGHPAVSVPNGLDPSGMPTGILLVGRLYAEATLLMLTRGLEAVPGHEPRRPPLA
ncbi:MAG: amidase [Gammaproteobacteria bacterium]|nr:amidase [Gammaproteobacteria bacterium]MDH4254509.1 amidase [Gammaproteobacteria bacterium]MDH5309593.1 amidase [Gammaproteobacteria bacterium]